MPATDTHPSAEELGAFTLGRLDDALHSAIESHLAVCTDCLGRAAAAPDDSLVGLLKAVHSRQERQGDTARGALGDAPTLSPVPLPPTDALPGEGASADGTAAPEALTRHDRYRLVRLLGQGGMGEVYEAEHRVMGRSVALKVINRAFTASPAAVERFRREVRAASKLSHPNVVHAYDAENAGETHFLVMEFVTGVTLSRLVQQRGPLPIAEACEYVRQAALGLQHAHERGLIHRDVKPDNLILTEGGQVKVLDFGLAALTVEGKRDGLTDDNVIMGTPDYLAPEQAEDARRADGRADVYSLGCSLYYLLTAAVPFPGGTPLQKILAHRERPAPSPRKERPDVPRELDAVVRRMLAKRPEDRYQTAGEVAAALAPFTQRQGPRRRLGWLVAAGVLLLAAALAAGAVVHRIQTDNGELVIETQSEDVEVVVKQGGKVVRIIDTKTGKSITLRSGVYELETKDGKGLQLDVAEVTLKRGEVKLAKVIRRPKVAEPEKEATGKIEVIHRVSIPGPRPVYQTAVSPDGKLFAAAVDGHGVVVWDGATGKELRRLEGFLVQFSPVTGRLVTGDKKRLIVHDPTGKTVLKTLELTADLWGFWTLADGRHAVLVTENKVVGMADLDGGKILQAWKYEHEVSWAATDDGTFLFVKDKNEKEYRVLDVTKNKLSDGFVALRKYERIVSFRPGGKQAMVVGNGELLLVNVADGKKVAKLGSTLGKAVAAARNGDLTQTALEAYDDGTLRLFDLLAGKERATFRFPDGEKPKNDNTIWLSPDGRFACVSTDRSVYLLRLPPPAEEKRSEQKEKAPAEMELVRKIPVSDGKERLYHVAISASGKYALVTHTEDTGRQCDTYEVATGKKVLSCRGYRAEFLGDGEQVVFVRTGEERLVWDEAQVYELPSGKLSRSCRFENVGGMMLVAPGGKHLAWWSPLGYGLLDLTQMKHKLTLHPKSTGEREPHFSIDGKYLFTPTGKDTPYAAHEVETGRKSDDFRIVGNILGFFPDGKTVAVYRDSKAVRLDVRTGKEVEPLTPPPTGDPVQWKTSVDCRCWVGRYEDGTILQYQLPSWKKFATYRLPEDDRDLARGGHAAASRSTVSISADGRFAAVLTTKSLYVLRLASLEAPAKPKQ